jgi:thiol-disulfide isomerase/thioredoxin
VNKRLLVGIVVVGVAAAGGFIAQRMTAARSSITAVSPAKPSTAANTQAGDTASATQTALPDASAVQDGESGAPPRRVIPETLPAFSLADRDGVARDLSYWKGRPLIVNFWATWCGPCREEIPLLKTLRNERAHDQLEVIGIAIDARADVLKYARDIGIDYPILIGEKDGYAAAEAFGVSMVLPFSVFADRKGRIVTLKVGELHANEAGFILDRVRDVDANRLDLTVARQQIADKMRDFAVERGKKTADSG